MKERNVCLMPFYIICPFSMFVAHFADGIPLFMVQCFREQNLQVFKIEEPEILLEVHRDVIGIQWFTGQNLKKLKIFKIIGIKSIFRFFIRMEMEQIILKKGWLQVNLLLKVLRANPRHNGKLGHW